MEAQLLLATATWRRARRRPLHAGPRGEVAAQGFLSLGFKGFGLKSLGFRVLALVGLHKVLCKLFGVRGL